MKQVSVFNKDRLEKDLKYIKNDIITKQLDGSYCKYSPALNAIATYDITKDQYISYWSNLYKKSEYLPAIVEACKQKLSSNLTSKIDMVNFIKNSKDNIKEKIKVLKKLGEVI